MRALILAIVLLALVGTAHAQSVGPFTNATAVTPSDSAMLSVTQAVWIGGPTFGTSTTITVVMSEGGQIQFTVLPGTLLPIKVKQVKATGTAATNIVALR